MVHPSTSNDVLPEDRVFPANRPSYVLRSGDETLLAYGVARELPGGAIADLAGRVRRHFEEHPTGPDILVGAIPYAREAPAHLLRPEKALRVMGRHELATPAGHLAPHGFGMQVTADPSADVFSAAVARGLERLREEPDSLRKIVLSRSLRITVGNDISIPALIARLAVDDAVVTFATPLPPREGNPRFLVGATPELLVERRGSRVFSHPLAGSARRSPDGVRDREAAEALLRSEKDRREHALVVEQIMDVLSPLCTELQAPDGVTLKATRSMWHLGTRIKGALKDIGTSSIELAALLHPTPAVCGMPRREADAVIRDLEGYDRGFYAGAVGWCDSSGDGRWYVSIRCAEIEGRHARLYAGAGIVPGSTPEGELAETAHKFSAMLEAFGLSVAQIGEA